MDCLLRAGDQYGAWANNVLGLEYYKTDDFENSYKRFVLAKKTDFPWSYFNLLEKYYLPIYKGAEKAYYIDKSITINELVSRCMSCEVKEIVEKTKALLNDFPEPL